MAHTTGMSLRTIAKAIANRDPIKASVSLTRPSNTTAYAIGDIVAPADWGSTTGLEFENVTANPGGTGLILNATLITLSAETTRLAADLSLFSSAPIAATADNDAFAPTALYMEDFQAIASFEAADAIDMGDYSLYTTAVNETFKCASDSKSLYCPGLVARNAYAPIADEKIILILDIVPQDISLF